MRLYALFHLYYISRECIVTASTQSTLFQSLLKWGKYKYLSKLHSTHVLYLQPINMTHIENTFSVFVFGDTFPKPTLVRLLNVKYSAVMYFDLTVGPPVLFTYGCFVCSARSSSHPIFESWRCGRSAFPIAYQIHASQWAISANVAIRSIKTAAPYSE